MRRPAAIPSLPFAVDRSRAVPLQHQLADSLRKAIAAGLLAPGARVPSIRDLAAELGLSRVTVSLALQRLLDEELLVSRPRSGLYVARYQFAPPPRPTVARRGTALRLSERGLLLTSHAPAPGRRPRAFLLSRPALELFPVREWHQLLARRAARTTLSQLDYGADTSELRRAIAGQVSATRGFRVGPEQVLLFAGSQRALQFAATCMLDPGEVAWMEDPGYPGALQALRAAGARVVHRPVDAAGLVPGGRRAPRFMYVTPSNQFPLGGAMSLERRRELLDVAQASDACIVEDDYDVEFSSQGARLPALSALDRDGRVLYLGSFSRTTAPSIRIGYLVAPAGVAAKLRDAAAADDPVPALLQLTLADFIAQGHFARHLRRMRKVYAARRDALVKALSRSSVLRLRAPPTGLHAVVELPGGCDDAEVSRAALARGIEALPLSSFSTEARLAPALVLGYAPVRPDDMAAAVRTLEAAVAD